MRISAGRVKRKRSAHRVVNDWTRKGYVYFIGVDGDNYVKIGTSRDEESMIKRFQLIRSYNHKKCILLGFIKKERAELLEKELHNKYNKFNIHGEWFNLEHETVRKEDGFVRNTQP